MAKRPAKSSRLKRDRARSRLLPLLKQVQYRCYLRLESALQPLGVAAVQYRILSTVRHRGKLSSAQLARIYDVRPQTMFKQVAQLEAKGLIRRAASDANKRVLEVELSKEGEAALAGCNERAFAVEAELFGNFTPAELMVYRELTTRILQQLRETRRESEGFGAA